LTRRRVLRLAASAGVGLAGASLAACGVGARPQATATPSSRLLVPTPAPGQLVGVLPASDLAVGPNNRFLLGLLDDANRPVTSAQVQLQFFKLVGQAAEPRGTAPAPFRSSPQLGDKGLYVARASFDEPGPWGVEVRATRPDGTTQTLRLPFEVRAESQTPAIGRAAPASQTVTAATPADAEKICSARPVDEFHRLSVADALAQRKPLLVLFATPGFCPSRTCGPDLEVVQAAIARHGDRLNVVHVEIYKDAQPPDLVPAVAEWNLPSEPWVFLVDADGKIVDKFEGGVTVEELDPALAQLVGA
jgi:hypothetical protein